MTSQSPRIYLYKITFEEVPYYYYGVHKEKKFNEYYMGSPVTHKWCWELYTPKKQILELFEFSDKGWIEAQEVENRLIKLFYNTDKWCLNAHCGGIISLEVLRKNARRNFEEKKAIFSLTMEEMVENGKMLYKNKIGIHGRTKEDRKKSSSNGGKIGGKISGERQKKNGTGIHGRSKEKMSEDGRKSGPIGGKITSSQKWMCEETGFISNAGALSKYQKVRGIDTSKRKRIE